MCDVQCRFVFLWGPASIEHLKIPLLPAKPKPGCRLQNVTRHSLQAGVNDAHRHGQVRWGEHLTGAACHALGGNSSSKPCPGLSQDHQPGFPEMPWLYLQLGWVLLGVSPYDLPDLVSSTVVPITPYFLVTGEN